MEIPTYEQIMLPMLELLKDENTYNNKECVETLSEKIKSYRRSSKRTFTKWKENSI
ncbi:hypothetical protein G6Y98_02170 [Clostridium perfringens]|uniref:hypothetical protein n=1 Tax=Clostridium perfringens TaxID=1502 RepID=UPI0013E315B1|nr:hypothetical protein [Clostridium perfringens]MDH2475907.1 hypothetical protein [Clostridium perfringens]NGT94632.1 hypothetical protein [Clostridium perfringens]